MINLFEQIQKSALKFLEPLNTRGTYETVVKEAIILVGAEYGAIFTEKKDELIQVFSNIPKSHHVIPNKRGYTYKAFITGKPIVISRREMDKAHPDDKEKLQNIRSITFIPLTSECHSMGVLVLQSKNYKYFNKEKQKVLKLFGSLASLAIRQVQSYEEVKKALKSRDLFISIASHELKTPLTTIRAYIQLLNSRKNVVPNPKWIEILDRESLRLTHLINELLWVEQIKKGRFNYVWSECSLKEICFQAMADFEFNNPNHIIKFENKLFRSSDLIVGDSDKLVQVLINLLNNAAKFSPENSPIVLQIRKKDEQIIIKVKDEGCGIVKEDIPKIFQQFYQGKHKNSGMGLGLYVVKEIIQQHEGNIKVTSRIGKGTTFQIILKGQE